MKAPSVVIAGAGLAATRCAETLRAEGYEGRLTILGAEPVAPYERPALSKEFLAGTKSAEALLLRPPGFWAEHEIELRLADPVAGVDVSSRVVVTVSGKAYRWEALVIATGARPLQLPFAAPAGIHHLRTLADAVALREALVPGSRLAIVGGGFVGAEVASTARALGVEVTLLDRAPAPFARLLGLELAETLAARYRAHGVDLRNGVRAAGFKTDAGGRARIVSCENGDDVSCDAVLVAIGAERADELVRPARGVYVVGDAAGGHGHWTDAATGGVALARRLLGHEPPPRQPPFVWSDQFGLRLQLVGEPAAAASVELEGEERAFVARFRARGGRLVAALAANRADAVTDLRRELAA